MKVGIGYDVHAFGNGGPLMLGGVEIPFERGLAGHSDGDVVCHAICDAMFGAAGVGDLGTHFPSGDPQWADTPGLEFLRRAVQIVNTVWAHVISVDVTLVLEQPSIAEHRDEMRRVISVALGIKRDEVSVKATTTDGLGMIGRGEGAAAMAVAVLESRF